MNWDYQNEHNSVKETAEKDHENLVPLLQYILKAFLKTFPTKMKPTKCPAKETKLRQAKR